MRTTSRRVLAGLGTATAVALVLVACAAPPAATPNTPAAGSGGSAAPASNFVPCMVSDSGGFNDKSFNQLGFEGLTKAATALSVKPIAVESKADTDYKPNIDNLVAQNCNVIVTVGFLLAEATKAAAAANPKINFAIVDDSSISATNVKPIVFDTAQAAFLAGYAAASYSKTGIVGTFGGIAIPPVTIFMDGFAEGVKYFNDTKGKSVKVLGWDVTAQNGVFTGGFAAGTEAKAAAQGLIDQNADVILPVGGPIFLSAGQAIRDSKKPIALIGVDADTYLTAPDLKDLFLTSVLKGVGVGVEDVVTTASKGSFDKTPFVGTLKNGGVGLAPFHDYESKVAPELAGELKTLQADIISGKVKVTSPSSPK